MFNKITRYTPEMYLMDMQGPINEKQRTYATRVAKMKGATLREVDNRLSFTLYSEHKTAGGYSHQEYIFRPSSWAIIQSKSTSNEYKKTLYRYD